MRDPKLVALALIGTLLGCGTSSALACECQAPTDMRSYLLAEFDRAALVFLGTSQSVQPVDVGPTSADPLAPVPRSVWDSTEVRFTVDRVWKGTATRLVRVRTAPTDGSCGTGHHIGQQYIVFAYAIPNDDELHIELCSPTTERVSIRSMFEEVLEFLGAL